MSNYFELLMNDPDFIFEDAESAFFHFNIALTDKPRSPLAAAIKAEEVAIRQGISNTAAALIVGKEINLSTSPDT